VALTFKYFVMIPRIPWWPEGHTRARARESRKSKRSRSWTGPCLRSVSSTVALSLLRCSRKLALRAQTVRLSDAMLCQAPQRFGHNSRSRAPVQLRIYW